MHTDTMLQQAAQVSHYVQRLLQSRPERAEQVGPALLTPLSRQQLEHWWSDAVPQDDAQLAQALRHLRQQAMLALIARDIVGLADLDEVVRFVSQLADFVVQTAYTFHFQALVSTHGQPIGEETGEAQALSIIGMGKLGGEELNVSSDIDLIFIYPEDGETQGPRRLSNHEFFTRLGQRVIRSLHDVTADGFVFRVDMRLRPHGESGPLVASHAMLENYLITQGREWERYAWMKARVITGESTGLMSLVRPFVYRKYLDYGAYAAIRDLHAQIRREVSRRDKEDDIKLGPGGIREIEFIAQIFQLIRGGRAPRLQLRGTRAALREIAALNLLPAEAVDELLSAYDFLRRLEHRLQYLDDQQTQRLPTSEAAQAMVTQAMQLPDYASLLQQLEQHRQAVTRRFEQVFIAPVEGRDHPLDPIWLEVDNPEQTLPRLAELGFAEPATVLNLLAQLKSGNRYQALPENCRRRLDWLVPPLLAAAARQPQPDKTLSRLLHLLEVISRRESYLALLVEHPQALQKLATLYAASPWVSEYLTRHPILLDELLDVRVLYTPPERSALANELAERLAEHPGDTEQLMNVLRDVHHTQVFRLVAQDLAGMHTVEALGDYLSDLADVLLAACIPLCWQDIRQRHCDVPRFAVVGYGKLGGKELGYATDLDLIFLYDDPHPDASENYARLAKRLSSWLSTPTPSGYVYELDLRLRPNGESGLLVSTVEAFTEYQMQHAWIWEHQALTRARYITGDAGIGQQFEHVKQAVLARPRDTASLRQAVLDMRDKMRHAHPSHAGEFDVKHDAGGLIDVEFCVQYLVLTHAARYPELTRNSGNIALLKAAGEYGLIPTPIADAARDAYRQLRHQQHVLRLGGQLHNRVPTPLRQTERDAVLALWQTVFEQTR